MSKFFSIHVLMITIGRESIFTMLESLKNELLEKDFITIVFDSSMDNYNNVIEYCKKNFKCKYNIIYEKEKLGKWGQPYRNKYNVLEGDFVYHVDDDDIIIEGSFDKVRNILKDKDTIYVFRFISDIGHVVWTSKTISRNEIGSPSGFIPSHINDKSVWGCTYDGDWKFYKGLEKYTNKIEYINEVIYDARRPHKKHRYVDKFKK